LLAQTKCASSDELHAAKQATPISLVLQISSSCHSRGVLQPSAAGTGPLRGTAESQGLVTIAGVAGIAAVTAIAKVAALAKLAAFAATCAATVPPRATAPLPVLLLQLLSISLISIACCIL
jgi:hypothetical protein